MNNIKHSAVICVLFTVALVTCYLGTIYLENNNVYNFAGTIIWENILALFLAVIFSFEHVKSWFCKGRFKVNYNLMLFSLLTLTVYIPGTPLFHFFLINQVQLLFLIFWFCLIQGVYKVVE
jgi:hypothetical protein